MRRRLSVLGHVRYSVGRRTIPVSGALASVIGYLALSASSGRQLGRDRVAFSLWPDRTETAARRALADALYRLGQLVGDDGLITRTGDQIGLGDVVVDLHEFTQLASSQDPSAQRAALDLYVDDLLIDVDADWAIGQREATRVRFLTTIRAVWEIERSAAEAGWGVATAQRWAQFDPWDEQAHRAVLRSLAAAGQLDRAAGYFDELVRMLHDELGVEPSAETQAVRDHLEREAQLLAERTSVTAVQAPFVGRTLERTTLIRRLDDALAGSGGLAVLLGDAGMGKSRLLDELATAARWRGAEVATGRVDEFSLPGPGAPFVTAIADALTPTRRAQLSELIDVRWLHQVEARLGRGAADASRTESHVDVALPRVLAGLGSIAPQVLLLDDMHWADPDAWVLLDTLQRHLAGMAVQIVVAARLDELRRQPEPWAVVRRWDQAGVAVIELSGMSADELGQLGAVASGVSFSAEQLCELQSATSGNPLFALALIESHTSGAVSGRSPGGLAGLLDRQLAAVSNDGRTALGVASLIGSRFPYERWRAAVVGAEVLGAAELVTASTELERARLVAAEPSGLRFAHDTLRAHVVAGLTPEFRRAVHAALLDVGGRNDVLDALRHAEGAADTAAIAELSIEAGLLALDGAVFQAASDHFERALCLIGGDPVGPADGLSRFVALLGSARALDVLGDRDRQRRTIEELSTLGAALGERRHVEALRMAADFAFTVGDYSMARSTAEHGLALLEANPDRALEAALLQTSSLTARELGDYPEAARLAERCLEWFVELGDRAGAATMTDALGGLAWRTGDKQRAAELHAAAAREFGAIGALMAQARALNNLGTAQWDLGRFHEAWATHAEAVQVCRDLGDVRGEGDNLDNMGGVRWALGDMAGAIDLYEQALAIRRGSDDPWGVAISLGNLADAHRCAGDLDHSLDCATEALGVSRSAGIARTEATSLQAIGATLLELGRLDEALEILAEADAAHIALGDRHNSIETRAVRARALLAAGDTDPAQASAGELVSSLMPDDPPSMRQSVWQCAYECTRAPEHLAQAQAAMAEYLAPLDAADRDRIVAGHPVHRRTSAAVAANADRIVVHLAAVGTPLGRAVTDADRVAVTWTLAEPADAMIVDPARRRRRVIARLLAEAAEQGGAPVDDDLAAALGVSRRTIIRDMEALAAAGDVLPTRRRSAR